MTTKMTVALCALALAFALPITGAGADVKKAKLENELSMGASILQCKTVVLVNASGKRGVAQYGCPRKDGWGTYYYTQSDVRPVRGKYRTHGHEVCYDIGKHKTHSTYGTQCARIAYDQSHKRWKYTDSAGVSETIIF